MAVICAVTFMGCEKDEQESFKFDIENLYGTWQGIAIQSNGEWIDICLLYTSPSPRDRTRSHTQILHSLLYFMKMVHIREAGILATVQEHTKLKGI